MKLERATLMEIQIISGFLGAGKTTFINRYLPLLEGTTAVIENEFGDVGLDGELIREDVPIQEIYAGCICCSLAYDFRKSIREIAQNYGPDRIIIEPSGVGRLSDIIKACRKAREKDGVNLKITKVITIVDLASFEDCEESFGTFYLDQIENAGLLFPTHLRELPPDKRARLLHSLRAQNPSALLYEGDFMEMDEEAFTEIIRLSDDYEEASNEQPSPALPADKVFSSISFLNPSHITSERLSEVLGALKDNRYGTVLRAKGILDISGNEKMHFDYTPSSVRCEQIHADIGNQRKSESKVIIIGCGLNERELTQLFR